MKLFLALFLFVGAALLSGSNSPRQMDGEQVYRDNCTRCHIAFQNIPARALPAVVHHMQVRALLTRPQQEAVLRYLLETAGSSSQPRKARNQVKKP